MLLFRLTLVFLFSKILTNRMSYDIISLNIEFLIYTKLCFQKWICRKAVKSYNLANGKEWWYSNGRGGQEIDQQFLNS